MIQNFSDKVNEALPNTEVVANPERTQGRAKRRHFTAVEKIRILRAVAESFFGTLKSECVTHQFATHALARTAIFEYIEVRYNRQRLHSTLPERV